MLWLLWRQLQLWVHRKSGWWWDVDLVHFGCPVSLPLTPAARRLPGHPTQHQDIPRPRWPKFRRCSPRTADETPAPPARVSPTPPAWCCKPWPNPEMPSLLWRTCCFFCDLRLRLLLMKRKGNSKLLYTVCNPREAFLVEKLTLDLILFRKFKGERKATLYHTVEDKTIRTYKVHQSISKLKHVPSCNSSLTRSPSTLLAPPLLPPPTP